MKKTPLATVKEKFGDKAKLVDAVKAFMGDDLWLAHANANADQARTLAYVSNSKLLKLHATFTAVKAQFGTREKLAEAILELEKRPKDTGYKARLMGYPVPRLYDAYKATKKRAAAAVKKA